MQISVTLKMLILELLLERLDIEDALKYRFICRHVYSTVMKRLLQLQDENNLNYPFRKLKQNKIIENISQQKPGAEFLDLSGMREIKHFSLKIEMEHISVLNLDSCWSLDEHFVERLFGRLHSIVRIKLSRVYCINDRHLGVLAHNCRTLKYADLQQCWRITDLALW